MSEVATQLEHDATKQMYERLIAAQDKPVDFDDTIKRDLEGSRTFQEAFCCTDPVYTDQIAIVVASKPDVVKSDTVGEYLYGCFQPELAVEIACTPACADGLKNPDLSPCEIASYEKKHGKLTKINNVNSEDANVFIASGESLTNEDKINLQQQGVKVITTYNQDGDTINYILGESLDISQPVTSDPPPNDSTQSGGTSGWAWVWGVIILIIIIILLVLLFRNF